MARGKVNIGGGVSPAKYDGVLNELIISQGQLAYSNLILDADHANDLDNGKSYGYDYVQDIAYKVQKGKGTASLTLDANALDTTITVDDATPYEIGDVLTLQDTVSKEEIEITNIVGNVLTVAPITNSYTVANGAVVYENYEGLPAGVADYDYRNEVLANQGGAQWTKKTNMNVLPDSDGWSYNGNIAGTISNGVLNITTGSGQNCVYSVEGGNIDPAKTKVLLGRIRVNANSVSGNYFGQRFALNDGVRPVIGMLTTTGIVGFNGSTSPYTIYSGDMTFFQEVKFVYNNVDGLKVYIDGELKNTISYNSLPTYADNSIQIGDTSSSTVLYNGDVDYDYIYYQLDLDANPDLPATSMDLLSLVQTLDNPGGATVKNYAKFGTGGYVEMVETSPGHWVGENETEEDIVKYKTEVVGDPLVAQWTNQYEASVTPVTDGWTLNGAQGGSVAGGIFTLNTNLGSSDSGWFNSPDAGSIVAGKHMRLESTLKVISDSAGNPGGHFLRIQDGTKDANVVLKTDRIQYKNVSDIFTDIGLVDLATNFVKVRIELDSTNGLNVWADGVLVGNVPYSNLDDTVGTLIAFGDFTDAGSDYNAEAQYDYVYYQLDLDANPDGVTRLKDLGGVSNV